MSPADYIAFGYLAIGFAIGEGYLVGALRRRKRPDIHSYLVAFFAWPLLVGRWILRKEIA